MSKWLKFLIIFLLLCLAAVLFWLGWEIPMESQIKAYEGLRNTAAIIFGVMGAWLAILHPESLKTVFRERSGEVAEKDWETITLLLLPIVASTFILVVVLLISPAVLIAKSAPWMLENRAYFRGVSFTLLCGLTVAQLWALIMTLEPGDIIKRSIQAQKREKKLIGDMFTLTRTRKKKDK